MKRDFSEKSKQRLLNLVDQVENEKWCDLTDWFGDRWLDFQEWIGKLNINQYLDSIDTYHKKVIDKNNTTRQEIERIFANVASVDTRYSSTLCLTTSDLNKWLTYIRTLSMIMDPAHDMYSPAIINALLNNILNSISPAGKSKLNWDEIEKKIYNAKNKGYFGGDQGSPRYQSKSYKNELYKIFKKNNPDIDLSADEFEIYLKRMNSEGCGYVALINTVFCFYIDKPDEFRRVFGYSMYDDDDGNLAYDKLFMDLYSRMDNRDLNGKFDAHMDYDSEKDGSLSDYSYWTDKSGTGINDAKIEYYLEEFMREHGVYVNVENQVNVTPDNCERILESGKQIIILFFNGNLRNMNGTVAQPIDGGHGMTVIGVTPEGYYLVSSWGKQYYIDPNENTGSTSFCFSTVEY